MKHTLVSKNIIIILVICIIILDLNVFKNDLLLAEEKDIDIYTLINNFCNKLNLDCDGLRLDVHKDSLTLMLYKKSFLEVNLMEDSETKYHFRIDTKKNEIVFFLNSELIREFASMMNRSPISYISKDKSLELANNILDTIGKPENIKFKGIFSKNITPQNPLLQTWSIQWIRTLNDYEYLRDYIEIRLSAIDGRLWAYNKVFFGSECPTDVKLSKEEAINEAFKCIKDKNAYKVSSAELYIVQPNEVGECTFHLFPNSTSRLAWVIEFENIKQGSPRNIISYIDAEDGKYLGGDFIP